MISEPSANGAEPEPTTCSGCGETFPAAVTMFAGCRRKEQPCPSCVRRRETERQAREAQRERERRWAVFTAAVPLTYRENDPARLPADYPTWQAAADAYRFGPEGLAFIGPNGAGKTRAMSQLVRRLCIEENRKVLAVSGVRLADTVLAIVTGQIQTRKTSCVDGGFRGVDGLTAYLGPLIAAEALFLDDLDKGRWTACKAAPAAALYRVLEERRGEGRPVFFTANTGAGLARIFAEEHGRAIVARLKDHCRVVKLGSEVRP